LYRPRFGLFSQPAPIAISESNAFKQTECRKNEEGLVDTEPRNFYTTRMKKGATDKILFSKPGYNCLGDPYQEAKTSKARRPFVKDGWKMAGHDFNFKPARTVHHKVPNKLPYRYMEQGGKKKIIYKDAEGAVITGPPNFYTNEMKKGRVGRNTTFGGKIPHHPEDPEAVRKVILKELAYHHSKLPDDGRPFRSTGGSLFAGTFSKPKEVYGGPSMAVTRNLKVRPTS
jgi:hypothetical protein